MLNNGSSSTLKDFDTLGKLGQGSFGVVYKVKRIVDGNVYVMKQINISKMNSRMKQDAINEVHILSKLNNPYVVRYYDSFIDKNVLCIVMEYCDSGDLSTFLKSQLGRPLQEMKIWKYFIMSCMGLDYIHRKKILHRDIKAMNIFLNKDDSLRIGDLGVAKVLSDQGNFAHTMVGTPFYLSPEMCEEKPYNEKSDIWSLGCVLYELCTYRHPFEANNQGALVLRIIRGKYNPIPTSYSKDLVSMVDMCLCKDYKKRPNARDILQTQIVLGKANQLGIELDYTKVKQKEINYQQKKEVSANVPTVPSTPSSNKNLIDKQREKNNALLNPNNQNKPISHSPSSHNVQAAAQQKAKDDLIKKMQQDERDLNKKVEQKLFQQNVQQIQNNDKKYKDRIQELYKKEEQFKMQQKQELERQKQTEQVLQMQKKREEQIKKEEERKLIEKKKKEAEKKKEEEELRKKKELEKQKQEKAAAAAAAISQQQQIVKEKEEQIKNEFKIRQNGFDPRVNQASQQQQVVNKIERSSPKQSDSKKQLFGNQMPNNFNKQPQQVQQQQPPSQFGYQKQQIEKKKEAISERKESIKPKEDDRKNIQRIRKGAPTGLGNIAKNPLSYGYKDVRQSKDGRPSDFSYEQDMDRQEVYNLPDNVHKQRNAPKSAQPYKPTVNDLRNIASQGFEENTSKVSSQRGSVTSSQTSKSQNDQRIVEQKKLNRPEQGKLPSVESFDSSFEDSPNKHISVQSASTLQKQTQEDKDIQNAIQNQDLNRPHTGQLKEKLHYNKPFVNKEVTDKYEKELQKQSIQQIVNDSFIDKEFGSSSEDDKKTKQKNVKKSDKVQNLENTQFEFIPVPKAKQLNDWNDKLQQNNQNSEQQLSSEEEEEDDNKLGDEYFKSQTINRGQLDLPDDMGGADDDEDEEEQKDNDDYNEEDEDDQYYQEEDEEEDQNQNENSQDEDQDIESIPDQNDWQKDEEEDEYEDDQENEYEQQAVDQYNQNKYEQDEYEEQSYEQSTSTESSTQQKKETKKRDLEQKLQARLKRQNELQTLLDIKVQECHKVLGEQKFNVILQFFKNKLNCEKELTDEDQDEIDQMMQENMKNITNNQVIHNFYKILHLDIELEKCKSDVRSIQQNIQQLL